MYTPHMVIVWLFGGCRRTPAQWPFSSESTAIRTTLLPVTQRLCMAIMTPPAPSLEQARARLWPDRGLCEGLELQYSVYWSRGRESASHLLAWYLSTSLVSVSTSASGACSSAMSLSSSRTVVSPITFQVRMRNGFCTSEVAGGLSIRAGGLLVPV